MIIEINNNNIDIRLVNEVVEVLENGGIIIYPTDTVYALGCDIFNESAFRKICKIRGIRPEKADFSFVCNDLSHLANYTLPIDNSVFRLMKSTLPGPFTYILRASNNVPKMFKSKRKKTVGIRVPDHDLSRLLVNKLGRPLLSASLKNDDDFFEYHTDPYEIYEEYQYKVDLVIDGGIGGTEGSTIIDCVGSSPVLLREGLGKVDM